MSQINNLRLAKELPKAPYGTQAEADHQDSLRHKLLDAIAERSGFDISQSSCEPYTILLLFNTGNTINSYLLKSNPTWQS